MNKPEQDLFICPANPTAPVDTVFITAIYLQRPANLANYTMGKWFAAAHNLNDKDLINLAGSQATKMYIVNQGYNQLPLDPLFALNKANEEAMAKRRMK